MNLVAQTLKQLESVQNAISKVESGAQGYFIEENAMRRELRRADVEALYKRENDLIARYQKLTGKSYSLIYPSP